MNISLDICLGISKDFCLLHPFQMYFWYIIWKYTWLGIILAQKIFKIQNSYFAYLWTNGPQNGYSVHLMLLKKYKKCDIYSNFCGLLRIVIRTWEEIVYKWKLLSRWNSIVLHIPKTVWRCENYYATQYCEVFQFRQPNFSRRRSNLKRNFEVVFLQNHVVVLHNWIKFYMKSHLDLNSLQISWNGF